MSIHPITNTYKDIDLKSEVATLSDLINEIVFNIMPDGSRPVAIPRRRLQAIDLLVEASQLIESAAINLNYENVIATEGES